LLRSRSEINDAIIENMLSWYHSGFHVYIGDRIEPDDKVGLGNLARHIIRACFSQERMVYVPEKNLIMVLPRLFTPPKIEQSKKFSMP